MSVPKKAPLGGGAKWVVMQRGRRVRPARVPKSRPVELVPWSVRWRLSGALRFPPMRFAQADRPIFRAWRDSLHHH